VTITAINNIIWNLLLQLREKVIFVWFIFGFIYSIFFLWIPYIIWEVYWSISQLIKRKKLYTHCNIHNGKNRRCKSKVFSQNSRFYFFLKKELSPYLQTEFYIRGSLHFQTLQYAWNHSNEELNFKQNNFPSPSYRLIIKSANKIADLIPSLDFEKSTNWSRVLQAKKLYSCSYERFWWNTWFLDSQHMQKQGLGNAKENWSTKLLKIKTLGRRSIMWYFHWLTSQGFSW
jgi:hypothetical protein